MDTRLIERRSRHQAMGATWRQALTVLNIGWDLALPIFGGILLGHHLDRQWESGYTYTIGLLVLGLSVGIYNLARTLQRELRRHQISSARHSSRGFTTVCQVQDRVHGEKKNVNHL